MRIARNRVTSSKIQLWADKHESSFKTGATGLRPGGVGWMFLQISDLPRSGSYENYSIQERALHAFDAWHNGLALLSY